VGSGGDLTLHDRTMSSGKTPKGPDSTTGSGREDGDGTPGGGIYNAGGGGNGLSGINAGSGGAGGAERAHGRTGVEAYEAGAPSPLKLAQIRSSL
jgi:hypothetical protein